MERTHADVVVVATHPDDGELCCGGTIAKLTTEGHRVVIADCTRGELGSRGTVETRRAEAEKAGAILNIAGRVNLEMPDGNIQVNEENILKLVQTLRRFRPKLLLLPGAHDRHIDHEDVHALVRKAVFQSGLPKIQTEYAGELQEPYRPARMLCYMQTYDFPVNFYVNISGEFSKKLEAIRAYSTQFHVADAHMNETFETFISRPEFLDFVEARARYFGAKIGVRYAEAFASVEPVGLKSLSLLFDL